MVLAAFNNRTQALQFSNQLRAMGVSVKIINTPREISTSCGLSIMFKFLDIAKARAIVNGARYASFKGFYLKKDNGRTFIYEKTN